MKQVLAGTTYSFAIAKPRMHVATRIAETAIEGRKKIDFPMSYGMFRLFSESGHPIIA